MTIIEIISRHLQTNRRLVVPALGCFIVKDAEEILFSELLLQDDGVLRSLLTAEGLSEMECAVQLDRFIFEVRHALETSGCCTFNGFGVLRVGEQGRYTFEKSAVVVPEGDKVISEQELIPADCRPVESESEEAEEQELYEVEEPQPKVESTPPMPSEPQPQPQEVAPSVEPIAQPAPQQPAPAPQQQKPLTPRAASSQRRRPQMRPRRKGADRFVILAVVVLVVALAAIGYGYYCSRFTTDADEQAMDALRYRVEEPASVDAPQN